MVLAYLFREEGGYKFTVVTPFPHPGNKALGTLPVSQLQVHTS